MKKRASILTKAFLIICGILLSSCKSSQQKNVEGDVVFCYLSSSFIDDSMTNWRCYADIISFDGKTYEKVHGYKHSFDPDIYSDGAYVGRLFSFPCSSYILGGTFGMGYINTQGDNEVPVKTPIISRERGMVFNLSINSSYSQIKEDTSWVIMNLTMETFVSLIFKDFDPNSAEPFGYLSYWTLKETFIDNLADYSDDGAKELLWNKNGREVNFYDELKIMKNNYYSHKKETAALDISLYVISALITTSLLGGICIGIVYYVKRKKQ